MISTVIFDYGGVLAYPVTGNWFITPNTKKILSDTNYSFILNNKEIEYSFRKAQNYLNSNHLLHTEHEEYLQFIEFFHIIFESAGFNEDITSICEKLSEDVVYNDGKVQFFSDVSEKLNQLKKNYKIIILSDTWPSLKRILNHNDILPILDGLIMSCDYGETKETTKLFDIMISSLKLDPKECIFVDDSVSNLENAEKTGLKPVLMDRKNSVPVAKYPIAKNINDVINLIGSYG